MSWARNGRCIGPVTFQALEGRLLLNAPPIADASGSYQSKEGGVLVLQSVNTRDPDDDPLVFEWDLDADEIFGEVGASAARGDETGPTPTMSLAGLDNSPTHIVLQQVPRTGIYVSDAVHLPADHGHIDVGTLLDYDTLFDPQARLELAAEISFDGAQTWQSYASTGWEGGSPFNRLGELAQPGFSSGFTGPQPQDQLFMRVRLNVLTPMAIGAWIRAEVPAARPKLRVTDPSGASGTDTAQVEILNRPPSVELNGPQSGLRGERLMFAGRFLDPGLEDTWSATVDFGDGSGPLPINLQSDGGFEIAHEFGEEGEYRVLVVVRDDDGGIGAATHTVTIRAAELRPDTCNPGELSLLVAGTRTADHIEVLRASRDGDLRVLLDGVPLNIFQGNSPVGTIVHVHGRILVYGLDGADMIKVANGVANEAWLYGDDGDDELMLGKGGGLLLGGAGDDLLTGGAKRGVLIGGPGADSLSGSGGQDILIPGFTSYDDRYAYDVHEHAFCDILSEWGRSDVGFRHRVNHLRFGGGLNDPFLLTTSTVFDDQSWVDVLLGGDGNDWIIARLNGSGTLDQVQDLDVADILTRL